MPRTTCCEAAARCRGSRAGCRRSCGRRPARRSATAGAASRRSPRASASATATPATSDSCGSVAGGTARPEEHRDQQALAGRVAPRAPAAPAPGRLVARRPRPCRSGRPSAARREGDGLGGVDASPGARAAGAAAGAVIRASAGSRRACRAAPLLGEVARAPSRRPRPGRARRNRGAPACRSMNAISLAVRSISLSRRWRSAARSTTPVELHVDLGARRPPPSAEARGRVASGSTRHAGAGQRLRCSGAVLAQQARRVGRPGLDRHRQRLRRRDAALAPDVADRRSHVCISRLIARSASGADPRGGRPAGYGATMIDSPSWGSRCQMLLGDERHERVEQPQRGLERLDQRVLGHRWRRRVLRLVEAALGDLEVPVAELVPQELVDARTPRR